MQDLITALTNTAGRRIGRNRHAQNQGSNSPVPFASARNSLFSNGDGDLPLGDRAYEAYGSVGTLFAIVTQISQAFCSVPWHLYRKTSVRDKSRRTEVMNHPFTIVWDRPNFFYTGRYFRECVQQHLDLVGEGVIVLYKVGGLVIEMWPVRPDRIKPVKHETKFLTGYIYTGPNGEEVPLQIDEVIQIKYPNPGDPYRGMGPVQTILNDIDASRYSAEWNKNFFINGAQPGGVIEVDYRMSDPEWEAFNKRWRYYHQGVANAHRVAVLENAHWKDTKFSMEDMQFVELRNLPRELIREAFAYPKPMLGTVDDVNRANADAGKEIMAEGQTKPRLSRWKDIIDNFLLPQFANGKTLELDFDDPIPVNRDAENAERNSKVDAATKLVTAGWDPNDVLEACGLPEMNWIGPTTTTTTTTTTTPQETNNQGRRLINGHRKVIDYPHPEIIHAITSAGTNGYSH